MQLLAIVHIFYPEVWPEIADGLAQLDCPFDLRITCVGDKVKIADMVHARFPQALVECVENRGFDMGPFFHVLNSVDLNNYDIVVKLHTKRNVPAGYEMRGYLKGSDFRNMLLRFTRTTQTWKKAVDMLSQSRVGMVADSGVMLNRFSDPLRNYTGVIQAMQKAGLEYRGGFFAAGSMFMVRASLLKPFQGRFHMGDFEIPDRSKGDCLPHFLERALGYAVYAQGYRLASWDGRPFALSVYWWRIRRAFFHVHHGKHHDIFRVCGIPVWYRRTGKD